MASELIVTRKQLQNLFASWNFKEEIPKRGDFYLKLDFPGKILNKGVVRKMDERSTDNETLYKVILYQEK